MRPGIKRPVLIPHRTVSPAISSNSTCLSRLVITVPTQCHSITDQREMAPQWISHKSGSSMRAETGLVMAGSMTNMAHSRKKMLLKSNLSPYLFLPLFLSLKIYQSVCLYIIYSHSKKRRKSMLSY